MTDGDQKSLPPILHLNTARTWRGGENQTLLLCRGLAGGGYRSMICCPKGSPLDKAAREEGLTVFNLPLLCEWDFFSALCLTGLIRRERVGILHMQTAHAHAVGVMACILTPRCRVVLSRRVDFHIRRNPLSWIKYRLRIDRIICVSEGVKRVLVSDGIDPGKCNVVHDGIDLDRLKQSGLCPEPARELGLDPDDVVIGTIGALAPHKDLFNLIDAAAILIREFPQLRVLIAGEGELYDRLVKARDSRGLENVVSFLGFRRDVPELFKLLQVFVLSSYLEGLSSSLLDAMASGTPIVATRTGGVPEIVKDGVNGLLVPPRDPEALAGAIGKILKDTDLGLRLALTAAEFVRQFSAEAMIEGTLAVYHKLISGHRAVNIS